MGNAEERAFITGDGVGKPLGLLAETGGAKVGVTAAQKDAVSFDEIFKLYYALKAPYRKKAQFLCNEALVLQLMTIKDNNGNYIWKPGLEIGKPDTLLNRPLKTSAFMPEIKGGSKVMAFGDYSYYWVADRQNRTFRRLNELYDYEEDFSFVRSDYRSGAGCLLVPHHPHRIHGREDQLWPDPGDHHPERQAQLLHSLCAEYPQGQQQAAG